MTTTRDLRSSSPNRVVLSPRTWLALQLRVDGIDYDTIGKRLHCTRQNARAKAYKAIDLIERALRNEARLTHGGHTKGD